jgi:hypothetical protein
MKLSSEGTARSLAHLERARILAELGASRLSELEQRRAGVPPLTEEHRDPGRSLALRFPDHTPPVVVLGVASKIPPLAAAADTEALQLARRLAAAEQPPAVVADALDAAAASSAGVDALLLADAAEQAGSVGIAAGAYERIARATRSGAAFARAATLLADSSAESADRRLALRAYLLARRANEQGDPALDVHGRLAPAVSWLSASSAASGNGSLPLVHHGHAAKEPLGVRIRRALLDADPDSILLSEDRRLELHTNHPLPLELSLNVTCLALEQGGACQASVDVDGQKADCAGFDTNHDSFSATCRVSLAAGKHRVDIVPRPGQSSVMAALVTNGRDVVLPRVVSTWTELDPAQPLELRVHGPTVLRITSRVKANQLQRIALELASPTSSERRVWEIPSSADAAVSRQGERTEQEPEFGAEHEHFWVIEESGEQRFRINLQEGYAVVRLHAAFASGVPARRAVAQVAAAPAIEAAAPRPSTPPAATVHAEPAEGPLTLNATVSLERTDLSERDGGDPQVQQETRVAALRELWRSQAYVSIGLIHRARRGADSRGAAFATSSSPRGVLPGTFARGLMMQQTLPAGIATGLHGSLGLLWSVRLSNDAVLVPWVDVSGRRSSPISDVTADVDADVYTTYARRQPVSLSSGLRVDTRPFVDTLARYGLMARYGPRGGVLDRAEAVVSLDTLPGSGFVPWLSVWGGMSHRPSSVVRKDTFTRTTWGAQLNFFGWARGSERWLLFGSFVHFVDWPAQDSTLSFALGLSVDETFRRGLRDYAPRGAPFRGRLEEGSGRVQRRAPARERAWETEP